MARGYVLNIGWLKYQMAQPLQACRQGILVEQFLSLSCALGVRLNDMYVRHCKRHILTRRSYGWKKSLVSQSALAVEIEYQKTHRILNLFSYVKVVHLDTSSER